MYNSTARSGTSRLPVAALLALLLAALISIRAEATSPPDMPLPPCTVVDGVRTGACPAQSDDVSGSASGRFVAGGSVVVNTDPKHPVCNTWGKYTGIWEPSPCFANVAAPQIVGCATIDLRNFGQFRELPCNQALYRSTQGLPSPLFTMRRPGGAAGYQGRTACGDTPDYWTFFYGGPSTDPASIWTARGPSALTCEVTFAGPRRPDGLYGPTWVKVRVALGSAVTGDNSSGGKSESADFYVPIDGDMRGVDVDISGTATMQNADWDNGKVLAVYRATLSNRGGETAENVELLIGLPKQLKYQSTSDSVCTPAEGVDSPNARGGNITCKGFSLAPGSYRTLEVIARIVNATDLAGLQSGEIEGLRGVKLNVRADNETDTTNNSAVVAVDIPFRTGSYDDTLIAMKGLAPYFNYQTDILKSQCNVYKTDIFARLEQIHAAHPEVFANLSYGGISSGEYDIAYGLSRSLGHVGVVVYPKGTNYRQAGIVINGTPSISPLTGHSYVGTADDSYGTPFDGSTSGNGKYLRTAANQFPGLPTEESSADSGVYGFEGRYGYNSAEFGGTPDPLPVGASCPFEPDAVVVTTESPVDIIATNSRGQRVETQDGKIIAQELDGGIHSMAFPHGDGTYGWTLVLPKAHYDIQLRGTRAGSYRLTLTNYAADGTPSSVVTSGTTAVGQVDRYTLDAPDVAPPTSPPTTSPPAPTSPNPSTPTTEPGDSNSGHGGGGSLDVVTLVAMLGVLGLRAGLGRVRRERPRARKAGRDSNGNSRTFVG